MLRASALIFLLACAAATLAQDPFAYQQLQWRMIGPFRGGRTVGVAGVPTQPGLFYIGVNNGGVWKTDDFGNTWNPIFDDQPTGSVGALAVAPSNPNTIYVGSGEGLQRPDLSVGDGVYKSTDGGKSWKNTGIRDGEQIGSIIVDPSNSNRVFVAVLGHPYGPNDERGVFRTLNGGQSWEKVLYKDPNTGAIALAFDPRDPQVVYADMWAARQGPWENGGWQGDTSGLFKSTDGGNSWTQLTTGLPTTKEGLGRIGFCVCPSAPDRIYALVDADKGGLYRSEDGGQHWQFMNGQYRIWGRGGDFAEVRVDPKNPDILYIANTSTYKSIDGGKSFEAWKGSPGGDDYHTIYVDPNDSKTILLASDQGAVVTVNGGRTWSSWYNQPTAQFYHVITDNQVPYWVYGGQQESGSAGISSRGNDGEITFREWHPVGAEEYGYIAPDPLNPNIIYGGKLSKFDKITGQVQEVAPQGDYRALRTAPLAFSPVDPHELFFAGNVLFKSTDGAHSWTQVSPDLSREHPDVPDSVGIYKAQSPKVERRGVIYSLGLSPRDKNIIWAGTDDGQIDITQDGGKSWKNVTPPQLTSWNKVSIIDAGHFDNETAYAAINDIRLDDMRPHILSTHDGGKSWNEIVAGLPKDAPVNTVKEDPVKLGLLYCGTEHAVYFSINDGKYWRPLRQNMPATSIRDLVVHADDLVAATHGRSFWIMDDIWALRELTQGMAQNGDLLDLGPQIFAVRYAYRFRRDTNTDTPLPPEVPAGQNPPNGAIIDYYLGEGAKHVTLEIDDARDQAVRTYSSDDKPDSVNPENLDVPTYWIKPFQKLGTEPGGHRFVWDMHWQPIENVPFYSMGAIVHDTPSAPSGPLAEPGTYTAKLTVDGSSFTQTFQVLLDPRYMAGAPDYRRAGAPSAVHEQFVLSKACYDAVRAMRAEAVKRGEKPSRRNFFGPPGPDTFYSLADDYSGLMSDVDRADAEPTSMMQQEFDDLNARAKKLLAKK